MCPISNSTRSYSNIESSWQDGSTTTSATGKDFFKALIIKANSLPILDTFKYYGLKISESNKKTICPFLHHQGGKESTASFNWYPNTNMFRCFGCNVGGHATDFVSIMDRISKSKAAYKIINSYGKNITIDDIETETIDYSERLEIMIDFSNFVREYMTQYSQDKKFTNFVEWTLLTFDKCNEKHMLDNECFKHMIIDLKQRIMSYLCP